MRLRALGFYAAQHTAQTLERAGYVTDYGYECDEHEFRWYVYIF